MKRLKYIICLLAVALAGSGSLNAQGLGFYLGGKRVELVEGDSINFVNNDKGQVEVKVSKDGQVEVYRGEEMTFYGDIERYLLDINNAMHYYFNESYHAGFGYGGVMHMRDVLTGDLYRPDNAYNWFQNLAENQMGANYQSTVYMWRFYENAITACNKLIGAIDETKATQQQKQYLGVAYAFRAMYYLDIARMYEYLDCYETKPLSNTGKNIRNLTVPIITEKTTEKEVAQLTRATRDEMKAFIAGDLEKAGSLLTDYKRSNKQLPDLACVYGLQARLNMWVEDYAAAAVYARKAISQSGAKPLTKEEMFDLENGFNNMNVSSWMWGVQPNNNGSLLSWGGWMSNEAAFGYASLVPVCIAPSLFKRIDLEDIRIKLFKSDENSGIKEPHLSDEVYNALPRYASLKFRPYKGNYTDMNIGSHSAYPLMRVEEMYFIEVEAKAHSSVREGLTLLENFMSQYRRPNYALWVNKDDVAKESAIKMIVEQKRIELWGEGLSFFDYKRLDMGVDRTNQDDQEYIPHSQQLCCALSRPAWMNLVFPSSANRMYKWNIIGQENPDPSGRYTPGGGSTYDTNNYYEVRLSSGLFNELFNIGLQSEYINVKACALDSHEGIVLKEPFAQLADSTMMYDGSDISIQFDGEVATLPLQPLGFYINGQQVMVKSVQNGSFVNGVVLFPKNSLVVTYGDVQKVVNSKSATEIRLQGSVSPNFGLFVHFYDSIAYKSSVLVDSGQSYLRCKLEMTDLDEVRLVCVPLSQAEAAKSQLKYDASYGVTAKEAGWVNIPMYEVYGQFAVVGIGYSHGNVAYEQIKQSASCRYPDYSAEISEGNAVVNKDGKWDVQTVCYFGPHVEKGYVALVEKYATEADIKKKFEAGTLPSCVEVALSHTNKYEEVVVPYPQKTVEYKLVTLAVAGDEVVNVECNKDRKGNDVIYECPLRSLSINLANHKKENNIAKLTFAYDASEFDGAYITLLTDTLLQGNVWENVALAPYKVKVSGKGTATIEVLNPVPGIYYTVVIAGCDAEGNIVKDVKGARLCPAVLDDKWYSSMSEWMADGRDASEWPLSKSDSTCVMTSDGWSGYKGRMPISYRYSSQTGKGQFKLKNFEGEGELIIDYDPLTSKCQVLKQKVTVHPQYGDLFVSDAVHYRGGSYVEYPCTYNKQTGKFSLVLEYFVNEGTFGNAEIIIQVDGLGNGASAAPAVQTDTLQGAAKLKNLKLIPNNLLKQVEAE